MKPTKTDEAHPPEKQTEPDPSQGIAKELGREVSKGLLQEAGKTLKWGLVGAVLGAVVLVGLGFWKFGQAGFGIGAIAGAVLGGLGSIFLYIQGTSLSM